MKKTLVAMTLVMAMGAFAQQLALSEARAKIDSAISSPAVMTSTVQQLSAEDQLKFLSDVNAAIAKMPGSAESKAASYVDVCRAALKGARGASMSAMLAEVFATVPLEVLTVLNENLAADLFNRGTNPSKTYTDEQFTKLAQDALAKISARMADVDNGSVRTGFAILMFTRASNGTPAGLSDTLAEVLPESVRETAKSEWFPSALAKGDAKSYDPMIGEADVAALPNEQVVLRLAQPQSLEALLTDLAAGGTDMATLNSMSPASGVERGSIGAGLDNGLDRVPFYYNKRVIGTQAGQIGTDRPIGNGPTVTKVPYEVTLPPGSQVPSGSVAGKDPVTVLTPTGETVVVGPGAPIPDGSKVIGGGPVVVPPGTPLAPGGMPVGPDGRPVGPGGRPIEPGGYDWQR